MAMQRQSFELKPEARAAAAAAPVELQDKPRIALKQGSLLSRVETKVEAFVSKSELQAIREILQGPLSG
jgi:hypothetical protein